MKSKIFWITVIFLLSFIFFRGKNKNKKLLQNIEYAQGYVIKVRAGVVTGGGIQFRIIDRETNYNLLMPWGVECEAKVKEMLLNLSNIIPLAVMTICCWYVSGAKPKFRFSYGRYWQSSKKDTILLRPLVVEFYFVGIVVNGIQDSYMERAVSLDSIKGRYCGRR
ncbi:MAG: hypothetical protein R2825_04555 [Saprospiraceae bacterium]